MQGKIRGLSGCKGASVCHFVHSLAPVREGKPPGGSAAGDVPCRGAVAMGYCALLCPCMPSRSCSLYQICLSVATSPAFRNTLPS